MCVIYIYLSKNAFCNVYTEKFEEHVPVFRADYSKKCDCLYVLLIVI